MYDNDDFLLVLITGIFIGAAVVALFGTIGVSQSEKQKDSVMALCIKQGGTYEDCLKAWNNDK